MIVYTVMNSDGQLNYTEVKGWSNEQIAWTNEAYKKHWQEAYRKK